MTRFCPDCRLAAPSHHANCPSEDDIGEDEEDKMNQQYRVMSSDENCENGFDECYSVLVGPNGFECFLGEPEDSNWLRDGRKVVDLLNKLQGELDDFLTACKKLLADRDADQDDEKACRRLYNAWLDIRDAVNKSERSS